MLIYPMLMGECAFVRFHLLCVITFMCFNRDFILCNFMYCTVFLFVCLRVILKLRIWTSVTLRVIRNGETIVGHCTTDVIYNCWHCCESQSYWCRQSL